MCYDISPKLVKIKYEETKEVSITKGDREKLNLCKKTFISASEKQKEYEYLDIKNYVNDVNRENSEVLAVQDQNGVEKEGYTYGLNRISAKIGKEDVIYNYSGRGDVSSIHAGDKKYSYSYDSYGNLLNEDGSAIGALRDKKKTGAFKNAFTYNGEQTDYSTNLQYLRNRYLDTETGTFLAEDTYRGSLTELKSHNRYSYAENNPVNNIDPSGHKAKSVSSKKVHSAAKAVMNVAKKAISNVSSSNKASSQKASRSKSSSSTHKAKTTATKKSSHSAKKSSGGGLFNQFIGGCSKKWKEAKKFVKKTYKKVCTTAKRIKKNVEEKVEKAVKKTVSVVKKAGKAISDFKKKHPILTGAIIIGAAAVLTVVTGGASAGLLGAACAGALSGSVIGAGAGATINFASTLMHGGSLKDALGSAAQGFGSGAVSGAISGAFGGLAGGAASAEGAKALTKAMGSSPGQWALRTLGDTAGNLGDRALNGEKITAGDVAFSLATNAAFNGAPTVVNKFKNTKGGQFVEKGISKLKNKASEINTAVVNRVKDSTAGQVVGKTVTGLKNTASNAYAHAANTVSGFKESVGNRLSGVGRKAVANTNTVAQGEKELPLKMNLQFFEVKEGNAKKIYSPVEYSGTVKVNGEVRDVSRRVYQRDDIDINYFDEVTGLTNLERMQAGKPPIGLDGNPIQLHHILQKEVGPMVEIQEVTHHKYYSTLHGLIENGNSFRNDPVLEKQYNNFRYNYWKWRAGQFLEGN